MFQRGNLFRLRLLASRAAVRLHARFRAGRFLRHCARIPIVFQRGNSFRLGSAAHRAAVRLHTRFRAGRFLCHFAFVPRVGFKIFSLADGAYLFMLVIVHLRNREVMLAIHVFDFHGSVRADELICNSNDFSRRIRRIHLYDDQIQGARTDRRRFVQYVKYQHANLSVHRRILIHAASRSKDHGIRIFLRIPGRQGEISVRLDFLKRKLLRIVSDLNLEIRNPWIIVQCQHDLNRISDRAFRVFKGKARLRGGILYRKYNFLRFNVIPAFSAQNHRVIRSLRKHRQRRVLSDLEENLICFVICRIKLRRGRRSVVALYLVLRIIENNRSVSANIRILNRDRSALFSVCRIGARIDAQPVGVRSVRARIRDPDRLADFVRRLLHGNGLLNRSFLRNKFNSHNKRFVSRGIKMGQRDRALIGALRHVDDGGAFSLCPAGSVGIQDRRIRAVCQRNDFIRIGICRLICTADRHVLGHQRKAGRQRHACLFRLKVHVRSICDLHGFKAGKIEQADRPAVVIAEIPHRTIRIAVARPIRGNALQQRKIDRIIAVFRRDEIFCNNLKFHFLAFNVIPAFSAQNHCMILSRSQHGNGFLIIYNNILTIVVLPYGHCGSVVALHGVLRIVEYNLAASVDICILL